MRSNIAGSITSGPNKPIQGRDLESALGSDVLARILGPSLSEFLLQRAPLTSDD
jgi:uncharacterized protein YidB (DUF937 family)